MAYCWKIKAKVGMVMPKRTKMLHKGKKSRCLAELIGVSIMNLGPLLRKERENILKIAKAHGAINIKIFGSCARGDEQPGSDPDLLVEFEPGRSLLDIIAIKHDIEDMIKLRVDVVTAGALSPYIREEIMKQAVEL